MIFINPFNCCTFAIEKSCLTSKLVYNAEVENYCQIITYSEVKSSKIAHFKLFGKF